jgi:hypothetical protein
MTAKTTPYELEYDKLRPRWVPITLDSACGGKHDRKLPGCSRESNEYCTRQSASALTTTMASAAAAAAAARVALLPTVSCSSARPSHSLPRRARQFATIARRPIGTRAADWTTTRRSPGTTRGPAATSAGRRALRASRGAAVAIIGLRRLDLLKAPLKPNVDV